MAVITTGVTKSARQPLGSIFVQTVRVPVVNANAADEWVNVDISVDQIIGFAAIGTAVVANEPAFKRNCQGTGQTEGATPGALAIESDASTTYEITVAGRLL